MDYAREAERHRHMAEEYRTMAEYATDHGLRTQYRKLAEDYERLADNEDRVQAISKFQNEAATAWRPRCRSGMRCSGLLSRA
jgi:hypothetical protein